MDAEVNGGVVQHVPLLVLGTGIEGLVAALALAHQGFPVHLLDRDPDPSTEEAAPPAGAYPLPPGATRELDALDLLDAVAEHATEPHRIVHADAATGRVLREIAVRGVMRERYGHPFLFVGRAALRRLLAEACAADDMVTVEYDRRPTLVEDVVDAVLVGWDGTTRYRTEALVAADGEDSRVRALLGGGQEASPPYSAFRADLGPAEGSDGPPSERSGDPDEVWLWSSPAVHGVRSHSQAGGHLVMLARADVAPVDLGRVLEQHVPEVRSTFRPLVGTAPVDIPRHHRPLDRWTRNRVTVLGAAAQPVLPHGGHAVLHTLADAAALGAAFDRSDGRILPALEGYEQARASARIRGACDAHEFAQLCHAEGLTRRLRDDLWSGARHDEVARLVGER